MESNPRTKILCDKWINTNIAEGPNAQTMEQWNLGKLIESMRTTHGLIDMNLPPEYTFIFDLMRTIYPKAIAVVEHFQASRKYRKSI
jgi:hypothetical protein